MHTPSSVLHAVPAPAAAPAEPRPAAPVSVASAIDELFRDMCAIGASDLHLSVGTPPLVRKDGRMQPLGERPALTSDDVVALLRPILPENNRREFGERH